MYQMLGHGICERGWACLRGVSGEKDIHMELQHLVGHGVQLINRSITDAVVLLMGAAGVGLYERIESELH